MDLECPGRRDEGVTGSWCCHANSGREADGWSKFRGVRPYKIYLLPTEKLWIPKLQALSPGMIPSTLTTPERGSTFERSTRYPTTQSPRCPLPSVTMNPTLVRACPFVNSCVWSKQSYKMLPSADGSSGAPMWTANRILKPESCRVATDEAEVGR